MSPQGVRTAVTMGTLVVVFCIMAVWGVTAATAPLPGSGDSSSSGCSSSEIDVQRYVKRADVVVSVYNAGARKHAARTALVDLESMGFKAGEVGNSPTGSDVPRAVVYTSDSETAPAELVARALGKGTQVVTTSEAYGPGVDVLIGAGFKAVDRSAPRKQKLHTPIETCVKVN